MSFAELVPPEHRGRLGLVFYFDTNFVDDPSPAAVELRQLREGGWILLHRDDTVDTELLDQTDVEKRGKLLDATAPYVESRGPAVLDHSRWDVALWASDEDEQRLDRVYRILWPNSDRTDDQSNTARRKIRDAMHVATARRYGANAFVTRDKRILTKAERLTAELDGMSVMTPEQALTFARRMKSRLESRQAPQGPSKPDAPPA